MNTQASTTLIRGQLGLLHRAARWCAVVSIVLAAVVLPSSARTKRAHSTDTAARQQFAKAERMREALNGRPAAQRTRHEYQQVIDAYRRVYFGRPVSSKADASVVATAELMVEMGRRFDDNKILRGAVDEYRFLRKEYPGSKYRFDALFTIGEIYKDDLDDPEEARTTFEDFLHRYPRNRLVEDARAAVQEIDNAADEMERAARQEKPPKGSRAAAGDDSGATSSARNSGRSGTPNTSGEHSGELPRVTGVRHWSTPDYTRVAIDIEREVKFNSERIANPDRIFFDLRDTKLASTLVGKTFDVDDGFLKKIRVAEFKPGRTRIVLEVDELSRYDAFLLPDPYRLIIDIHGKQSRAAMMAKAHPEMQNALPTSPNEDAPAADADDAAMDPAVDLNGAQRKSEKEHAIVAKVDKSGSDTETEDDDENPSADEPAKAADIKPAEGAPSGNAKQRSASGVVRTTVGVKGSDRRIPKTIAEPDDIAPNSVTTVERGKKKPGSLPEDYAAPAGTSTASSDMAVPSLQAKKSRASARSPVPGNTADLEMREAQPTAAGDRSLTRALGLKIGKIVIDAGHGGHDTGTIGPNGLEEKDLVLDVAKRLGRLLQTRMGAEVIYTRKDDTFIPLETRTAIANRAQADLFISIHANSSHDSDARGVETYYLNFTSSPEALEVAARENAVSEKSIHELQDLVKKIALKEKIDESREFAGDVQDSLYGGLALNNAGIRNRGIKKAPFIVLIGANMPSILAEISFVSNPADERKLETSEQRQRIADSLYRGVSRYASGLSGVKVASKIDKNEGQ